MNESTVDQMEITTQVYIQGLVLAQAAKKDQVLFIWNVQEDSYDYVIASVDEAMPDVVQSPYVTRQLTYKENPHE
jgi:hypothetical protein